ncbi:hypothetical protein GF322_01075 [Candidatus Dependentiae bacterium]|nr:hypothetical protein [Candidatus Dependentiae bacterium]
MDISLFMTIFLGMGIFYLILGLWVSRGIKTTQDFFLAGKNLGLFYLTFTLVATQIGGGTLLGTSAESYKIGYFGIFYSLGITLGFLFLGLGIASKLRSFNISTTAQLFELKYGSVFLKKIASILSVLTMFGLLGGQVIGVRGLLLGLGFYNEIIFVSFWFFIIIYTVIGGLKAVTVTDTYQVIFIVFLFAGLFIFSIYSNPQSLININKVSLFSYRGLNFNDLFPVIFNPMMFSFIEQDLAQRFLAAKTKKLAALSALLSSIFIISFSFIPVYFGMLAKISSLNILPGASPLVAIVSNLANDFFLILIVCGIAAALISTADSLLCAISSNICQDFDLTYFGYKNKLKISQIITLLVGFLALFVAYFSDDIISMLIQSYELSISCLFVPIIFCYFKNKLSKKAAFISIISGGCSFILFRIFPVAFPKELASLLLSFGGYFLGEYFEA